MRFIGLLMFLSLVGCKNDAFYDPSPKKTSPTPEVITPALAQSYCENSCLKNKDDEVIKWNRLALQIVKKLKLNAPVASRTLAIMHTAMFDAVIDSNDSFEPYFNQTNLNQKFSKEAVLAGAAYTVLSTLFPSENSALTLELATSLKLVRNQDLANAGFLMGKNSADALIQMRSNDQNTITSRIETGVEFWSPTLPSFKPYLLPAWGQTRPFALFTTDQFRQNGPPVYGSSEYYSDLTEVSSLGNKALVTSDHKNIAIFWEGKEGSITSPGHWNEIGQKALVLQDRSLEQSARLFALLNLALADASISAWNMKHHYFYWRPIQAVRHELNPNWLPTLDTPNHPGYVSETSAFSGAAEVVLTRFFGTNNFSFTYRSEGIIRNFTSFHHAAEEASISGLYAGTEFRASIREGQEMGRLVGEWVMDLYLRKSQD